MFCSTNFGMPNLRPTDILGELRVFRMKRGKDIAAEFGDLYLVHQNVPGKRHINLSHSSHILFIPLQGEIDIVIEREEFKVGPGHMLFLPNDILHSFDSSTLSGERLIAMINGRNPLVEKLKYFTPVILPLSQLVKEILFYLLLHPRTSNSKSLVSVFIETLVESLEAQGVASILATDHLAGKIKDERIRKVVFFVKDNFSEQISTEVLAKHAGLSSRNLNRLMLQEIGITPKQFLISTRIEEAQKLLQKHGSTVTEVALEVGYASLSQFIAAFRSQTGQLPSEVARFGRKPKI